MQSSFLKIIKCLMEAQVYIQDVHDIYYFL